MIEYASLDADKGLQEESGMALVLRSTLNLENTKSTADCDDKPLESQMVISRTLSQDSPAAYVDVKPFFEDGRDSDGRSRVDIDQRSSSTPSLQTQHYKSRSIAESTASPILQDTPAKDDLDNSERGYQRSEEYSVQFERTSHRGRWSNGEEEAINRSVSRRRRSRSGEVDRASNQQQEGLQLFGIVDSAEAKSDRDRRRPTAPMNRPHHGESHGSDDYRQKTQDWRTQSSSQWNYRHRLYNRENAEVSDSSHDRYGKQQLPHYPTVHRRRLEEETLQYFHIPFEYSASDPDYIVLFEELTQWDLNILFQHTHRLRSREDYLDQSQRLRARDAERATSFSKRFSAVYEKFGYTERDTRAVSGHPRSSGRRTSVKTTQKVLDKDFHVPPFLAWPTKFQNVQRDLGTEFNRESALLQLVLLDIEKAISKAEVTNSGGNGAPMLVIHETKNALVQLPGHAIPIKSVLDSEYNQGLSSSVDAEPQQPYAFYTTELTYLQNLQQNNGTKVQSSNQPTVKPVDDTTLDASGFCTRRVLLWQAARLRIELDSLVGALDQLIDAFAPKQHAHPLLQRCRGSVEVITKVVLDTCRDIEDHQKQQQQPGDGSSYIYITADIPDEEYMSMYGLQPLSSSLFECSVCRQNYRHLEYEDAILHLQVAREHQHADDNLNQRYQLGHWVVSVADEVLERSNERLLRLLYALNDRTGRLLTRSIDLRNSVVNPDQEKDARFLLPSAMAKAAEKVFQFIYYSAYSVQTLHRTGIAPVWPEILSSLPEHQGDSTGAEHAATNADWALSRVRDDLLLMAQTGRTDETVIRIGSTPETTILTCLLWLVERPVLQKRTVVELYRDHLTTLQFEASRKPSKRVLRELYLLDEEIEIMASVYPQQLKCVQTLGEVLDSRSFRVSTPSRVRAFTRLERNCINCTAPKHFTKIDEEIRELRKQLARAAQALRHNVEVAEEGSSKAIQVFTLVTIVFLPLSFVASMFGMNTSDIRNMNSTQGAFWAVALPVTLAIGGLSLLAAYGRTFLQAQLRRVKRAATRSIAVARSAGDIIPSRRTRLGDEEEAENEDFPRH